MPTSGIIYFAVGMVLAFAVTSAFSSAITEGIARFLGLRGEFLLRGLYELLDDRPESVDLSPAEVNYRAVRYFITGKGTVTSTAVAGFDPAVPLATSALFGSPILRNEGMAGQKLTLHPPAGPGRLPKLTADPRSPSRSWRQYRSLPSCIPATSFAEAVVDLVVPDATKEITMAIVRQNVAALPDAMATLKSSLEALVKNAGDDIGAFRTSVERWFDNQMNRVSREYKRHVTKIALTVGTILVLLLNINALTVGRYLYADNSDVVNAAVSSVAEKSNPCPAGSPDQEACLKGVRKLVSAATEVEIPILWGTASDCADQRARCDWLEQHGSFGPGGNPNWEAMLFLLGFLLTIAALIPGARFWFGLLTKLGGALGV